MVNRASAAPLASIRPPSREQLIHLLYEAAELEHTLMCTYLYAAFSLKDGTEAGLSPAEAEAVSRWRRVIIKVAVEEMSHLTAVWNITSALGGAPRFGRGNFPLEPGMLPAGIVVKLAPFNGAVIQHFIYLERPASSREPEGEGFAPEHSFVRGVRDRVRLTPMPLDYDTVGAFYDTLEKQLSAFVEHHGEQAAFVGDPALQLSSTETELPGARPVVCKKTALAALETIVAQGEGAPEHSEESHFQKFLEIRQEYAALKAQNANFVPAYPAAHNPVLRPPVGRSGRVWIEHEEAAETVDLANTGYALMLRLLAYTYLTPRPSPEKALAVDLALGLMRAVTFLAERAARLPAGPSNPECNAGMSFTALRDAAALPPGSSTRRFFGERLQELAEAVERLSQHGDERVVKASRIISDLGARAVRGFANAASLPPPMPSMAGAPSMPPASSQTSANGAAAASSAPPSIPGAPPTPTTIDGLDYIEGKDLTLIYEGKKCIHSRFCVTETPEVFLANVKGPWIYPDAVPVETLVEIAHKCPSGAIRYRRKDGHADEATPPVNLLATREAGPYAVRGDLRIAGEAVGFRATLCRCGASKNKPYCDGSHHEIGFSASGEPATGKADMLPVRNGPLEIEPQIDGPLQVRGNLEITSGTGRIVVRLQQARLCRCGGSSNKPFCDGTHARIDFKSS